MHGITSPKNERPACVMKSGRMVTLAGDKTYSLFYISQGFSPSLLGILPLRTSGNASQSSRDFCFSQFIAPGKTLARVHSEKT